jgi:TolA-binding protein
MDRMRDDVMERDGDVEALYRESRWRETEIASLVITYHLAWVRYQGAQLTTDAKRKNQLLDKAIEGFSAFLVVNEVPEVYAESQYGRGLSFLDMGNYPQAREDLEAAAKDPRTAGKAKAALAELDRRQTGKKAPVADDPETLLGRMADALPKAATDPAIEKTTTELARGLAARGGDWPKRVDGAIASKLGDGTPTGVKSSYGLALLAQLAIDRGRCGDVAALADASGRRARRDARAASSRAVVSRRRLPSERREGARGGRGVREARAGVPRCREGRDAAYFRFRALDVARASDPSLAAAYEDALGTFTSRYPKDDGANEAHYLAGELRRAQGDCAKAEAEYAKVSGGPYAGRARLGSLECAVGAYVKAGKDTSPDMRRTLLERLRAFVRDVPPKGPDEQAVARAALMGGLVAADAKPADPAAVIEFLDRYETRFPSQKDWHATAVQRRLSARVALGQLAEAEADLDAFLADAIDADRRRTLDDLSRTLQKQLDTGDDARQKAALALARKVYRAPRRLRRPDGRPDRARRSRAPRGNAGRGAPAVRRALAKDATSAEAMRGAARGVGRARRSRRRARALEASRRDELDRRHRVVRGAHRAGEAAARGRRTRRRPASSFASRPANRRRRAATSWRSSSARSPPSRVGRWPFRLASLHWRQEPLRLLRLHVLDRHPRLAVGPRRKHDEPNPRLARGDRRGGEQLGPHALAGVVLRERSRAAPRPRAAPPSCPGRRPARDAPPRGGPCDR